MQRQNKENYELEPKLSWEFPCFLMLWLQNLTKMFWFASVKARKTNFNFRKTNFLINQISIALLFFYKRVRRAQSHNVFRSLLNVKLTTGVKCNFNFFLYIVWISCSYFSLSIIVLRIILVYPIYLFNWLNMYGFTVIRHFQG